MSNKTNSSVKTDEGTLTENKVVYETNRATIHNEGNFGIGASVMEKWTATRKGRMRFGKFIHPGIFSTVGFNVDRSWFAFAMLIEISTIFISIIITGFNPIVSSIAFVVVVIDIALAIFLHKPQQNINKYVCELAKTNYENENGIFDDRDMNVNDYIFRVKDQIKKRKRKKIIPMILLIVIAVLKIMIGALALVSFSLSLAYIVPALFALTAYIHIQHTGYYFAESGWFGGFRAMYNKAHDNFNSRKPDKNDNYYYHIDDESEHSLNNISNSVKTELDQVRSKLSADEINKRRFNDRRVADLTANNILIYGLKNQQSVRVIFNEHTGAYVLTSWGPITDAELTKLINGSAMSDNVKSYMGYSGLKSQNYNVPTDIGVN